MKSINLEELARGFLDRSISETDFLASCLNFSTATTVDATLDMDRERRCGYPEVVYAEGKSAESLVSIFREMIDRGTVPLATRVSADKAERLGREFAVVHNPVARTVRGDRGPAASAAEAEPRVAIVTAGTTDLPVAEEARETLHWMQVKTAFITDVGVAGPHRLIAHVDRLRSCDVVIVIAGMEGALPSVVGGHVSCPVIAVPTSVGYGAAFGGVAALLGMLNSCAANVVVVNIDAGFKAAYVAGLLIRRRGNEPV